MASHDPACSHSSAAPGRPCPRERFTSSQYSRILAGMLSYGAYSNPDGLVSREILTSTGKCLSFEPASS
jgi:hypothetical protein